MNSKFHLIASVLKSIIRMSGCILAWHLNSVAILAGFFLFAEFLGVVEELGDER